MRPAEAALLAAIPEDPSSNDPVAHPQHREGAAEPRDRAPLLAGLPDGEPVQELARLPDAQARRGQPALDAGRRGAVLRELRQGSARAPLRTAAYLRRRAAGDDDTRRRPAADRPRCHHVGAAPSDTGPTATIVVLDAHSGAVVAMVGGENYHKNQFNLATQGERQPGSSFKPFVLATALKNNVAPSTVLDVAPGDDQRRRPAMGGQQLRGRVPRADRSQAGDRLLRQLRLLTADGDRGAAERARHRDATRVHDAAQGLLRDRARRRAGDPARDGARLYDLRRRRQTHRRLDLPQRAAGRQRDQGRRQDAGQQGRRASRC